MFEDMMHRSTAPQGAIDYAISTGSLNHFLFYSENKLPT